MREFIVWDDKLKEFAKDDYRFVADTGGHLFVRTKTEVLEHSIVENRYSHFYGIGKTDIEDNKIYADCSIVKFEEFDVPRTRKGFFYYCKKHLAHRIMLSYGTSIEYDYQLLGNFKIIGTLQETPELLKAD